MSQPPIALSDINAIIGIATFMSVILYGFLSWRLSKVFGAKEAQQDHEARLRVLEYKCRHLDTKK